MTVSKAKATDTTDAVIAFAAQIKDDPHTSDNIREAASALHAALAPDTDAEPEEG